MNGGELEVLEEAQLLLITLLFYYLYHRNVNVFNTCLFLTLSEGNLFRYIT